jgi:hypothetical protein
MSSYPPTSYVEPMTHLQWVLQAHQKEPQQKNQLREVYRMTNKTAKLFHQFKLTAKDAWTQTKMLLCMINTMNLETVRAVDYS